MVRVVLLFCSEVVRAVLLFCSEVVRTRTRPELNFAPVPEPVPESPVKSGTGPGTRLCHRYRYQALSLEPITKMCNKSYTRVFSIWTYHENILITNIKVNGPGNKI